MFKNSFSFKGRIRRIEYGISIIICTGIILITNVLALSSKGPVPVFLIYIPLLWFLWAQGAKRCHDIGKTGWYQIIPFYVFWMLFTESHNGINEYGPNPKGNGNQEQNIIVTKKEQYASETTSQTPPQYKRFDLPAEQSNFLATIKRKWGNGTEFFAGDAFSLISEEYLNWYTKEAESKNILCFNHRELATLELLEKFRI